MSMSGSTVIIFNQANKFTVLSLALK